LLASAWLGARARVRVRVRVRIRIRVEVRVRVGVRVRVRVRALAPVEGYLQRLVERPVRGVLDALDDLLSI